jgi:hypothetical protein
VDAEDDTLIAGLYYTVEVSGFIPGSTVEVELHSDPWSFGTWIANAYGRITARIQVPPTTLQGQHRLVVREHITATEAMTRSALRSEIPVVVGIDETPPVLVSASLSTDTVDVATESQDVVLTLEITDDVSGAYGMMWSFTGVWSISGCCVDSPQLPNSLQRVSGTTTDGTWQATFPVPAGTPSGSVCLDSWSISDYVGHSASGTMEDLCFVITETTPDTTPPVLVSASLSTDSVDVTSGSQDVVLTLEITDDVSGAYGMMWSFTGVWSISGCCVDSPQLPNSLQRVSGTTTDGTWQATFPVPAGTPSGPVCLTSWSIGDRLGNTSSGSTDFGGQLGIPDLCFTVVNTGG